MNKRTSNGDRALGCATPVSNLIVVHVLSLGDTLTVECSYNALSRSTSGMLYDFIIFYNAAWFIALNAFLKSTSTLYTRFISL